VSEDRVPLFVRLPYAQAAALDRLAETTGRRKQHIVSEVLADRLSGGGGDLPREAGEDVLTLEEVAKLLRVPVDDVRVCAEAGDLPGRRFGAEWRFVRAAVLGWLAEGEANRRDDR
jgi:excisionase family DNA binding protein